MGGPRQFWFVMPARQQPGVGSILVVSQAGSFDATDEDETIYAPFWDPQKRHCRLCSLVLQIVGTTFREQATESSARTLTTTAQNQRRRDDELREVRVSHNKFASKRHPGKNRSCARPIGRASGEGRWDTREDIGNRFGGATTRWGRAGSARRTGVRLTFKARGANEASYAYRTRCTGRLEEAGSRDFRFAYVRGLKLKIGFAFDRAALMP